MDEPVLLMGRITCSVYYEDTDFSGYVFHANYLKYFDRGREELIGLSYLRELYLRGLHFVVARAELAFHKPAQHGDRLQVTTKMPLVTSPIVRVEQTVHRLSDDGQEPVLLVSGVVKLGFIGEGGKLSSVPGDVIQHFQRLI